MCRLLAKCFTIILSLKMKSVSGSNVYAITNYLLNVYVYITFFQNKIEQIQNQLITK